jgi:large subunit ribosomal protein L4
MKVDVVNTDNKKVGSLELNDDVFGGRVNDALIWESVVHTNARRAAARTRPRIARTSLAAAASRGSRRAPAARRVGSVRNPLWRHGGTVFGPQPRSYGFRLPSKVKRGAIVAALAQRIQDGALVVVDALSASETKTKAATELLKRLGADGKALLIDVQPDEKLGIAVRNLPGVRFWRARVSAPAT